jgi:hypothetical protein
LALAASFLTPSGRQGTVIDVGLSGKKRGFRQWYSIMPNHGEFDTDFAWTSNNSQQLP